VFEMLSLVFLSACVEVTIVVGVTSEILAAHLPTKKKQWAFIKQQH